MRFTATLLLISRILHPVLVIFVILTVLFMKKFLLIAIWNYCDNFPHTFAFYNYFATTHRAVKCRPIISYEYILECLPLLIDHLYLYYVSLLFTAFRRLREWLLSLDAVRFCLWYGIDCFATLHTIKNDRATN